jgi:hypothetical protein
MAATTAENIATEPETDNAEPVAVETGGPLVFKSSGKAAERVVLFTIDASEYTVPKKPGANITLKFLNEMRKSNNEMFAALGLLEAMLGKDKYNELLEFEELDDATLGQILEQVVKLAMDRVEDTSGK